MRLFENALKLTTGMKTRTLQQLYDKKKALIKLKDHRKLDMFNSIAIETTSVCNRSCSYCPVSIDRRSVGLLEEKYFIKIINQLSEINFKGELSPTFYGEPFLDKRLIELLGYARVKLPKAHLIIFTNGDFLTYEVFKNCIDRGIDHLLITQHDNTRQKNLEFLDNLSPEEKKHVLYMEKKDMTIVNRGGLIQVKDLVLYQKCSIPTDSMTINYKGDIVLCCNDYYGKYIFGNIKKENLMDIWNKPEFVEVRKKILKGDFNYPICKGCGQQSYKGGASEKE